MELTFGMALVIASRERLCFVDLAERPDHELMFINVEIVLHNIHIRHTRITFFYVRFETILFRETFGSVTNFDAQFLKNVVSDLQSELYKISASS